MLRGRRRNNPRNGCGSLLRSWRCSGSVLGEKIASFFRNKHLGNNKTGYLLSQQLTASSEGHKLPYVPKSGVIPSTNPQNSGLSYFSWIERIFLLFSALPRVDEKSCLLSVAETMGTSTPIARGAHLCARRISTHTFKIYF